MTIGEWLGETMVRLREAGVDSPRRDALVLLEDTIRQDRAWVAAHPEYALGAEALAAVNVLIARRLQREPLAYIRGRAWFYGRFFTVNKNVLIPRPESENFIELLKTLRPKKVIDIGTGSGALAITAKLELPEVTVIATDISSDAFEVAKKNAQNHNVDIQFVHGSLLKPLNKIALSHSAIIANLPYVPDGLVTSPEISTEPPEALFAGKDGLELYKQLWAQLAALEAQPQYVLTEALKSQHEAMQHMAAEAGYKHMQTDILVQVFTKFSRN